MNDSSSPSDHIVILFYKYTPQPSILHTHSSSILPNLLAYQKSLCRSNNITKGRILLSAEGINGTLYGRTDDVENYIRSMDQFDMYKYQPSIIPHNYNDNENNNNNKDNDDGGSNGRIYSSIDWKKSSIPPHHSTTTATEPFPDLKISLVDEIVSTGRTISVHDIFSYGGTHLTPKEFHEKLVTTPPSNLVLLDIRNSFEHAIGHFVDNAGNKARNPNVTSFAAFDKALGDDCGSSSSTGKNTLKDKTVMMYCTGGIRCEKASVMLKKRGVENVFQLTGGIHRYLEEFNTSDAAVTTNDDNNNNNNNDTVPHNHGMYHGKNFVFDQRVALEGNGSIVGRCLYCTTPYDEISGSRLCTVCRDLVLVCPSCRVVGPHRRRRREYHCERHASWRDCYYTFLEVFTVEELERQITRLEELRGGEELSKNVRKTLSKQINKIRCRIKDVKEKNIIIDPDAVPRRCRTCFRPDEECDGLCWGFWKTRRQQKLQRYNDDDDDSCPVAANVSTDEQESILPVMVGDKVTVGPDWNELRLGKKDDVEFRLGIVIDVKSWGSSSLSDTMLSSSSSLSVNDCVVVQWDHHHQQQKKATTTNCGDNERVKKRLRRPEIYRWGVMAKNGKRMYDVKLCTTQTSQKLIDE